MLQIWMAAGLWVFAIEDFRSKMLSRPWGIGFLLGSMLFSYFSDEQDLTGILMGMIPGFLLLLLTRVKKESIGGGDALVLLATGAILGMWNNLLLLLTASCFAAIYALFLLLVKKEKKSASFPFVPFLALGNSLLLIGGLV